MSTKGNWNKEIAASFNFLAYERHLIDWYLSKMEWAQHQSQPKYTLLQKTVLSITIPGLQGIRNLYHRGGDGGITGVDIIPKYMKRCPYDITEFLLIKQGRGGVRLGPFFKKSYKKRGPKGPSYVYSAYEDPFFISMSSQKLFPCTQKS